MTKRKKKTIKFSLNKEAIKISLRKWNGWVPSIFDENGKLKLRRKSND